MQNPSPRRTIDPIVVPWLIVLFEFVSPIPAFLTIGAIYVLLARPPWFRRWVVDLYDRP